MASIIRETEDPRTAEQALLDALARGAAADAADLSARLIQRHPTRGVAWKVRGALLWAEGRAADAVAAMRHSVRLLPLDAEAHCNLGLTLAKLNEFAEGEVWLRRAIELDPGFATAHYRLGMTCFLQSRMAEAAASLRRGLALRRNYAPGDDAANHSNLLFILSHDAQIGAAELFAEHRRFGESFEDPDAWPRHANDRARERPLRVGLVSGDFREHAVAGFVEPLLAELASKPRLELHAYHNHPEEDAVTARLRQPMSAWHRVEGLSDAALAARIVEDGIDILVDLSGHTAFNRLAAFALKPAPVQVSGIGYPGTTGLRAMDYYLADPHFLPPGRFDAWFTERLVYLPGQAPYVPPPHAPPPNPLPALGSSSPAFTFGSFNRPDKINDATLDLWSAVLRGRPGSRMALGGIRFDFERNALGRAFAARGIAADRLEFHEFRALQDYLALHHRVDLCLDTTPYAGGTTTLHALWMGVPTLTLDGATPASRSAAAALGQVGLDEFVAPSPEAFIDLGRGWCGRLDELAQLRADLRGRWRGAHGRRPEVIADALDFALRRMWRRWCDDLPAETMHS